MKHLPGENSATAYMMNPFSLQEYLLAGFLHLHVSFCLTVVLFIGYSFILRMLLPMPVSLPLEYILALTLVDASVQVLALNS